MSNNHWPIYQEALRDLGLANRDDAPRWELVVALARERSYELSEVLWQFRLDGARLDLRGDTLKMGAGTMGPGYAREVQRWLIPFREMATAVLKEAALAEIPAVHQRLAVG